jgi:hypothetical protein
VIVFQRLLTIAMAGAMVFLFFIPLAMQRHQGRLAGILVVVFAVYLAANVWMALRMRSTGRR